MDRPHSDPSAGAVRLFLLTSSSAFIHSHQDVAIIQPLALLPRSVSDSWPHHLWQVAAGPWPALC